MIETTLSWTEALRTGGGYILAVIMAIVVLAAVRFIIKKMDDFEEKREKNAALQKIADASALERYESRINGLAADYQGRFYVQQKEYEVKLEKVTASHEAKADANRAQLMVLMEKQITLASQIDASMHDNTQELVRVRENLNPLKNDIAQLLLYLNHRGGKS